MSITKDIGSEEYSIHSLLYKLDVAPEILSEEFRWDENLKSVNKRGEIIFETKLRININMKKYETFFGIKKYGLENYPNLKESYLEALNIIHNAGIYHGDLHSDNLIYNENKNLGLYIDFGESGYLYILNKFSDKQFENFASRYEWFYTEKGLDMFSDKRYTRIEIIKEMERKDIEFIFDEFLSGST